MRYALSALSGVGFGANLN